MVAHTTWARQPVLEVAEVDTVAEVAVPPIATRFVDKEKE